jgi:hypothetical protein
MNVFKLSEVDQRVISAVVRKAIKTVPTPEERLTEALAIYQQLRLTGQPLIHMVDAEITKKVLGMPLLPQCDTVRDGKLFVCANAEKDARGFDPNECIALGGLTSGPAGAMDARLLMRLLELQFSFAPGVVITAVLEAGELYRDEFRAKRPDVAADPFALAGGALAGSASGPSASGAPRSEAVEVD